MENTTTAIGAGIDADTLIDIEVERQDQLWGAAQDRKDVGDGQLFDAAFAHFVGISSERAGLPHTLGFGFYPEEWTGYRHYGSEVANLVVAAAFIRQEIKRLLLEGADTTRTPRPE